MISVRGAIAATFAVILTATCAAPSVAPSATAIPPLDQIHIFYARPDQTPIAAPMSVAAGLSIEGRIRARFDALAAAPALLPDMSMNFLHDASRVSAVRVDRTIATLDFKVDRDDWGLHDSSSVRAFMEQVVFSVTDEPSIARVRLTENGGHTAVIAVEDMIVTYPVPLAREMVSAVAGPERTVVYFARDRGEPLPVTLQSAPLGGTADERIATRLRALETGPKAIGDGFNVVATMKAHLREVTVRDDLAIVDYRVPGDDWGVRGSASVRALVQQIVFTATEEPGTVRVLITQNGASGAIIGAEGLIVDRPQTRRTLLGGP